MESGIQVILTNIYKNMKPFFFIILTVLFASKSLFSQIIDFEIIEKDTLSNERAGVAIEIGNAYFVSFVCVDNDYAGIMKLDSVGDIIKEIHIEKPYFLSIKEFFPFMDSTFVAIGALSAIDNKILYYAKFNTDLDLLVEKKYYSNCNQELHIRGAFINRQGDIICGGYGRHNGHNVSFLYQLSMEGDSLSFKTFYEGAEEGSNRINEIIEHPFKEAYLGFGTNVPPYGELGILEIDTDFNIIASYPFPACFTTNSNFLALDDSTYVMSGTDDWYPNKTMVTKMDTGFNRINDISFIDYEGTVEESGYSSLVKSLDSTFYFVAEVNESPFQYPDEDNWILLNLIDYSLNLEWQVMHGGNAYYNVNNMCPTKDGGCIITGSYYNENIQVYNLDIHILKISPEPNSVDTIGFPKNKGKMQLFSLYPNPGNEELFIKGPGLGSYLFELYSLTGSLLFQSTISKDLETVEMASLDKGIYFYRIRKGNKIQQTGKWIKK